jgi:hypothetical protein
MKNQYFGDINDYRKYGLLRVLQAQGTLRLLVAWMLTPDDGSSDGGRRGYLRDPDRWRGCDPPLFDGLAALLPPGAAPAVALVERSGLLPGAAYYSAVVPDGRRDRNRWREGLLAAARDADLVFLDPDNGLEVPSKPIGRAGSSKYAAWQELQNLWHAGCSLLVYQHYRRERREPFAGRLMRELGRCTGARGVEAFRTPHVLFLLAVQDRHAVQLRRAVPVIARRWNGQFQPALAPSRDLSGLPSPSGS